MSSDEQVDYEAANEEVEQSSPVDNQESKVNHGSRCDKPFYTREEREQFRKSRKPPNEFGIIETVLFVSRFAPSTTPEDIRELMSKYGGALEINITRDGKVAFVDFATNEEATAAKDALHHSPGLGSDSLIVDFKKQPPPERKEHSYDYGEPDYRYSQHYDGPPPSRYGGRGGSNYPPRGPPSFHRGGPPPHARYPPTEREEYYDRPAPRSYPPSYGYRGGPPDLREERGRPPPGISGNGGYRSRSRSRERRPHPHVSSPPLSRDYRQGPPLSSPHDMYPREHHDHYDNRSSRRPPSGGYHDPPHDDGYDHRRPYPYSGRGGGGGRGGGPPSYRHYEGAPRGPPRGPPVRYNSYPPEDDRRR